MLPFLKSSICKLSANVHAETEAIQMTSLFFIIPGNQYFLYIGEG
jgi:hypothetical protein